MNIYHQDVYSCVLLHDAIASQQSLLNPVTDEEYVTFLIISVPFGRCSTTEADSPRLPGRGAVLRHIVTGVECFQEGDMIIAYHYLIRGGGYQLVLSPDIDVLVRTLRWCSP